MEIANLSAEVLRVILILSMLGCTVMMYLLILGSNSKEDRSLEDEEQREYLKQWSARRKAKGRK